MKNFFKKKKRKEKYNHSVKQYGSRSCSVGLDLVWGRGYLPIYDIVRMCVPNIPLFQRCKVYDKSRLKKKVYGWPYFLVLVYEWLKFSETHVYAHIFRIKGYIDSKDII